MLGAGGTMGFAMARNIARAGIAVKAIAERDFTPSFRLKLAAKDAALVTDAAWQHGLSLPVLEAIARRMAQGAAEHGDEDISATYLTIATEHAT